MGEFMNTLKTLIEENKGGKPQKYHLRGFGGRKFKGYDLEKATKICASTYEFWLHVAELSISNFMDYEYIADMLYDDSEDTQSDMRKIVDIMVEVFRSNDTLWYECENNKKKDEVVVEYYSAEEICQKRREQMNDLFTVPETHEEDAYDSRSFSDSDSDDEDNLATIHLKNGHIVSPLKAENYLDGLRLSLKKAKDSASRKELAYEIEQLECQLGYSL